MFGRKEAMYSSRDPPDIGQEAVHLWCLCQRKNETKNCEYKFVKPSIIKNIYLKYILS